MKAKELDVVNIDGDKANSAIDNLRLEGDTKPEILDKYANEIAFSVQEWGIKNNLRLIGYELCQIVNPPVNGKYDKPVPTARVLFADLNFKTVHLLYFIITEKSGKVSVTQEKIGFQYTIKVCKTGRFITKRLIPVFPVYGLLIDKDIIFPFEGTIKNKEWQALPFIEMGNMKPVNLFEKK